MTREWELVFDTLLRSSASSLPVIVITHNHKTQNAHFAIEFIFYTDNRYADYTIQLDLFIVGTK
jgi:hypothetical protein